MAEHDRVAVPGSERAAPERARRQGAVDPNEEVRVTVVVRPKAHIPDPGAHDRHEHLDRAEFAARYGASIDDLLAVERFAIDAGLLVLEADAGRRSIALSGPAAKISAAFGVKLERYQHDDGTVFRGRTGAVTVPRSLGAIVQAVFGLDTRPQARAHFRVRHPRAAAVSYTPPQVARLYDFPTGVTGSGQTIALIELGGGYAQADLDAYFQGLGVPTPHVVSVGVDGASNAPTGDPNGPDAEVLLDIEVAGAIAPGASIVVYFAPNTDQGFLDAITTAVHDTTNKPSIVSISWGGPESSWTQQALTQFDQAFAAAGAVGVTVCCAAGDNGSSDGVNDGKAHVDFPASSLHVIACGGTTLHGSGTKITSEVVWNDGSTGGATGGGVSDAFPLPAWQNGAGVPTSVNGGTKGRGVPDVAGDADPQTGYNVRVDGQNIVAGGTSAVAPLWAGLLALINQRRTASLGFINATLYAQREAPFHDITTGSNGAYRAKQGWDPCTGLGSPDGAKLATALG